MARIEVERAAAAVAFVAIEMIIRVAAIDSATLAALVAADGKADTEETRAANAALSGVTSKLRDAIIGLIETLRIA